MMARTRSGVVMVVGRWCSARATERDVDISSFPGERRAVTGALAFGRRLAPVHGLVTFDVTAAMRQLRMVDPPLSFTAFVVASVARAATAHPEVHAYRNWRGDLVVHRTAGVATLLEVRGSDGPFPLAHVIQGAEARPIAEISDELRRVVADPSVSASGRMLRGRARRLMAVPGVAGMVYRLVARSVRLRRRTGTISVSSVGMFGGGRGYAVGLPTMMSLSVVVGGVSKRPAVVDGSVEPRDLLDLTLTFDHKVVDGAPAARFVAELRRIIEGAEVVE